MTKRNYTDVDIVRRVYSEPVIEMYSDLIAVKCLYKGDNPFDEMDLLPYGQYRHILIECYDDNNCKIKYSELTPLSRSLLIALAKKVIVYGIDRRFMLIYENVETFLRNWHMH